MNDFEGGKTVEGFTYESKTPSLALETFEWDNVWYEHTEDVVAKRFLYIGDSISVGTRGWINTWKSQENYKILKRENDRLKLSINSGKKQFGEDKEMIAFIHYPPFYKEVLIPEEIDFIKTLKDNNISTCFYGHLHGESHKDAVEGMINGMNYKLISSDYLKFDLFKI